MHFFGLLAILSLFAQTAYAEVEVIEWGGESSESYSQIRSDNVVDIYVTSWCPYCRKAVAYLKSQGIKFNKYDIEKDPEAAARKKVLAPGYSGIPLAVINGRILKGFSRERYAAALQDY